MSTPRNNAVVHLGAHYDILGQEDHHSTYVPYSMTGDMPINYRHKWINGHWDDGGPWLARRRIHTYKRSSKHSVYGYAEGITYKGAFGAVGFGYPEYWQMLADPSGLSFYGSLQATGATYLARNSPVQPSFQAAASLYELKDVPETLKQATRGVIEAIKDIRKRGAKRAPYHGPGIDLPRTTRRGNPYKPPKGPGRRPERSIAGKAGDWHLAIQFGWLPILSDIQKFIQAQQVLDKRLRWMIRNEGKPIKVSSKVDDQSLSNFDFTVSHGTPYNPNMFPSLVVYAYEGGASSTRFMQETVLKTWFEGQCRFLLPSGPRDQIWNRKMRRRLLGQRVTPQAVWAVMPWSWLTDYFIDVGSFIEATQDGVADLLIWDYAYVMCEYQIHAKTIANQFVRTTSHPNGEQVVAEWEAHSGYKFRAAATPFGFGLTTTDLSARQLGILGALGMSRLF